MKDPNNTRDTVPRRGSPLWVYVVCVTSVGAAALAASLAFLHGADLRELVRSPLFWIVAFLIVLGELKPIITPGSTETTGATISTTFTFATMLYVGVPTALLLQAAATVASGVLRRRALHRNAFNVGQYTPSFTAARNTPLPLRLPPPPPPPWGPPRPGNPPPPFRHHRLAAPRVGPPRPRPAADGAGRHRVLPGQLPAGQRRDRLPRARFDHQGHAVEPRPPAPRAQRAARARAA